MTPELRGVALRLHGPLQAWGGPCIGDSRPTLSFPTRSGVLGLMAACLGIRRGDSARLLALAQAARVHVRVDLPGTVMVDDQTIQGNPRASATRQTIQSKRTYLCDASFVAVVVPGPAHTVADFAAALRRPVFAPFLGRRSCSPSTPLLLREEVRGDSPLELFRELERGPAELLAVGRGRGGEASEHATDYFLDVDECAGALRRLPVRDHFAGPLPRQYRERFAYHVQVAAQS